MKTLILLKARPSDYGTAQYYENTRTALSISLFVPDEKISTLKFDSISKGALRYNPHINQPDSPDLPLWHYRNYVKGFRFGEVWAVDSKINSDNLLIKYFNALYGGIIDEDNYQTIKSFVHCQIKLNSLKTALRFTRDRLFHIDETEQNFILESINSRIEEIKFEAAKYPTNLLKRNF